MLEVQRADHHVVVSLTSEAKPLECYSIRVVHARGYPAGVPAGTVGDQLGQAQAAGRGVYRTHMETAPTWQGAPLPEQTWEEWNAQNSQAPRARPGAGMMTVMDSSRAETRLQPSGALHIPRAEAAAAGVRRRSSWRVSVPRRPWSAFVQ